MRKTVIRPKRNIMAATAERSEGYEEAIDNLESNFDYAMEGFEKLARDGKEGERLAIQLILELNQAVDTIIGEIANNITQ